jgi:hypothetical protein
MGEVQDGWKDMSDGELLDRLVEIKERMLYDTDESLDEEYQDIKMVILSRMGGVFL